MRAFVTGGAGFIGSTLVDRLLDDGHTVVAYDNFSTGQERFLENASARRQFTLVRGDTLDSTALVRAMGGADVVFHLAANADVRFGTEHPRKDLEQNTIATFNVLEAMRANGVRRIAFSSTGSIYGEATVIPTPESAPFPVQTSLYGASKLAGEGLIQAYCEGFGFQGWIFRFVSILGERYTHGHVFDFFRSLQADPTRLRVLGDGRQRKSYLYVQDCIDAMLLAMARATDKVNIFNLGTDEFCRSERLDRLDHGATGSRAGARVHRRRSRLDWRQSVHLPRHAAVSVRWAGHPGSRFVTAVLRTLDYLQTQSGDARDASMKVAVLGLWHLGSVTAACLASAGHSVRAFDPSPRRLRRWQTAGRSWPSRVARVDRKRAHLGHAALHVGSRRTLFADADVVWVTFDTPVDDDDVADVAYVERQTEAAFPIWPIGRSCSCSSQLPVGTVRKLEHAWAKGGRRADGFLRCSPENLRLGKAIEVFTNPDRVIVGVRDDRTLARACRRCSSQSRIASSGCRSSRRR